MVKVKEVTLWVGGVKKNTPQVWFIRTNKTTKGRSHPCFFFPPLESMNCAELCTKPDWFAVLQNSAKIKAYWGAVRRLEVSYIPNCSPFQFEQNFLQTQKNPNNKSDYETSRLVYSVSAMLSGGQNLSLPDFFFFTQILLWARLPVTLW